MKTGDTFTLFLALLTLAAGVIMLAKLETILDLVIGAALLLFCAAHLNDYLAECE